VIDFNSLLSKPVLILRIYFTLCYIVAKYTNLSSLISSCRELNLAERCLELPSRSATREEILRLHTEEHFDRLKQTSGIRDDERMEDLSSRYDSIYIHPVSNRYLLGSHGSVEQCIRMSGRETLAPN